MMKKYMVNSVRIYVEIFSIQKRGKYHSALALMQDNIKHELIFLDIEMPEMTGIEAKNKLAEIQPQAIIIFMTRHKEYMREAFGKNVYYFLENKGIYVNQEAAECMLNHFAKEAEQNGIRFVCNGSFRSDLKLSSFQICTCFYNLLSNALEACKKVEDSQLGKSLLY